MNCQGAKTVYVLAALTLSFGLFPATLAAVDCTQATIQAIAPADTTIVSATPQSDTAASCDVLGYVTTQHPGPNQVSFELRLPAEGNGRFLFIGNGGFGGGFGFPEVYPDFENLSALTQAGTAIAFTDTGHQGNFLDGSWALNDQAKQDDYLFRGVHVAAVATKAITKTYYGRRIRSYFAGCSDGGREGLVEAQRYPSDFDGIVAGDPAMGPAIPAFNWNQEHLTAKADRYIPPDKLVLVDTAVMNGCDATDGVADGLIQDPRKCTFDPASLRCSLLKNSDCLTEEQIAGFTAIYAGARKTGGQVIYPGLMKSDPAVEDSWATWITGLVPPDEPGSAEPWSDPTLAPWQFLFQDQVLKFFVFADPDYNSLSFDIRSADLAREQRVMNRGGAQGLDPNLSSFLNRGGKLLIYHGWSDPAFSPQETIGYYNSIIQEQEAEPSVRLFMVPGMQHCIGTGPGPNVFDPLSSLVDWVERDVEPRRIIAAHFQNNDSSSGAITRTMPLCPYPESAHFKGGDVNQASSWTCHRERE